MFSLTHQNNNFLEKIHSNHSWIIGSQLLNITIIDKGNLFFEKPYLTVVTDIYSKFCVGFNLTLGLPNGKALIQALNHAISEKKYDKYQYNLSYDWISFGIPKVLYIDKSHIFHNIFFQDNVHSLNIALCHYQLMSVQRCLYDINQKELLSFIASYLKSSEYPNDTTYISFEDVERLLVSYIINTHNQQIDDCLSGITRQEKWQAGLQLAPRIKKINEHEIKQ